MPDNKHKQPFNPDKPLPHSADAEIAVLGAILIEPKPGMDNVMDILGTASHFYTKSRNKPAKPAMFYNPYNQRIYSTLCEMYDNKIDIDLVSLCHALKQKSVIDEIGGEGYLMELMNSVATTANLETWCGLVRDCAIRRNLITLGGKIVERSYDDEDTTSKLLDKIEKEVMDVSELEQREEIMTMQSLIKGNEHSAFNYLLKLMAKDKDIMGIKTNYFDLDRKITGLKPGEMFVLAARPSMGKTSFALNIASNISVNAENPVPVGFFSLEMTAEQLAVRMLCAECGYSVKDFLNGNVQHMGKVEEAARRVGNAPIFVDPTPALRIRELRSKARTMKAKYDIQIIFIDYLQLMKAEVRSDSRQEEVTAISSGIKALAKELKIPIIVLAQLNREVEKTQGLPKLSHLRESGAIEQDADVVAFLHRDRDEQQENSPDAKIKGLDSILLIGKNRNGETGKVELLFFPHLMRFNNKSRMTDHDMP